MMNESVESAAEYFKRSAGYQLTAYEKLIDKIPFRDMHHVFDLGCGTAAMSARMAKEIAPNGQVTACDPEESRIRVAMDKFSGIPNLHFIHATGSAALEDKADFYDVIVSNLVLHWMKEGEVENTMRKMFTALKSGGIAAHNFLTDFTSTCYALRRIDESKAMELLKIIHPIKKEKFGDMAREVGFDIVHTEGFTVVSEFDSVEDRLRCLDATTYGKFGWEKLYNNAKSNGLRMKFDTSDTGKPIGKMDLEIFILKRP